MASGSLDGDDIDQRMLISAAHNGKGEAGGNYREAKANAGDEISPTASASIFNIQNVASASWAALNYGNRGLQKPTSLV